MRYAVFLLAAVSVAISAAIVFPAPVLLALPFTIAAPELAPWLVLLNLFCIWIALQFHRRRALWIFIAGAVIASIPVVLAFQAARAFDRDIGQPGRFSSAQFLQPLWFPPIPAQKLPMNMLYYAPHGLGMRPVLIDLYGGAWQRGRPADDGAFDRHMAGLGYAVFAIDYRHAPAAHFPAQLDDVRAELAFIRGNAAQYHGDAARIVICGRSSGAQLALLAAYDPAAPPVAAVISFYGPTNLRRGYTDVPFPDPLGVRSILERYIGGTPEQFGAAYDAASPVTYATRPLPPTLLIQGSRDHIVKAEFARELYDKLKSSGTRAYLLELPMSEHAFDLVPSGIGSQVAMHSVETFLKTTAAALPSSD